ncbi:MAG TPA: hypothetical protein VGT44_24080, partial [Ktedonobacteraceae bacterium]|nr:hypothetical protein [Ktedonobacteraceae bacterium]
ETLVGYAQSAMMRVLDRVSAAEYRWSKRTSSVNQQSAHQRRTGEVLTYAQLCLELTQRIGEQRLEEAIAAAWETMPAGLDSRGRCLHIARHLWSLSGKRGPAIMIYYSPPFIPHVAATPCALHQAIHAIADAHPELQLLVQEYFPLISDMSYLRLDPGIETTALIANMPLWPDSPDQPARPGSYALPLEAMRQLDLPVVNLGPYGKGAHQAGERVLMSYSFGVVPQLIWEVIERLA